MVRRLMAKRITRAMRRFLVKGVRVTVELLEEEDEEDRRVMCGRTAMAMVSVFLCSKECGWATEARVWWVRRVCVFVDACSNECGVQNAQN